MIKYFVTLMIVAVLLPIFLSIGCSTSPEYLIIVENNTFYAIVVLMINDMQVEVCPQSIGELYVDESNYEYIIIVRVVYETGDIGIYRDRKLLVKFDLFDSNYSVEVME